MKKLKWRVIDVPKKKPKSITDKDFFKYVRNFRKNHGGLRFGQAIWNCFAESGGWEAPEANIMFFMGDEDFLEVLGGYGKWK